MASNILITGRPGIGKTRLVKRLIHDLPMLIIRGFYTEAIIENNVHRGFIIHTPDFQEQIMAHVFIEGPHRVGEFGVNLEGFEGLVLPQLSARPSADLFIIDEISHMNCLSSKFCRRIYELFDSPEPVIATMSALSSPAMQDLKKRSDVKVLQITEANRDSIWKNVLLNLS